MNYKYKHMKQENKERSPLQMRSEIISDKLKDLRTIKKARDKEETVLRQAELNERRLKDKENADKEFENLIKDFYEEFNDILDSIKKCDIDWYFVLVNIPFRESTDYSWRLDIYFYRKYMYKEAYRIAFIDSGNYELNPDMVTDKKHSDFENTCIIREKFIKMNQKEKLQKKMDFLKKLDELFN